MTDIDIDLDGIASLEETIDDVADAAASNERWAAGTAVEYAVYLEFGTRHMDPKPFVRPAARAYEQDLEGAIAEDTQTTVAEIDDVDTLVKTVAFGLERRIKRIITRKGLIESGTLRASVRAVPLAQLDTLPAADEIDPGDVDAETTREIEV